MLAVLQKNWDSALLALLSTGIILSMLAMLWPQPDFELIVEEGQPLRLLSETPRPENPAFKTHKRVPKAKKPLPPLSINLNTATAQELEQLPGIGPALAGRILAYRKRHGRFTDIGQLDEVSGIGPKTLVKLAPFLKI